MTDGLTGSLKILPYIRRRDVIVKAQGLKPLHTASIQFDGVGVESRFARATEIYIQYDPRTATTLFQPDVNGKYEKIKLTGGGKTANGILLAVRQPPFKKIRLLQARLLVTCSVMLFRSRMMRLD